MRDLHETCLEIENALPLWAGGDLEPDAQVSVESHLARCEVCSRSAVRARAARAALRRGLELGSERMGVGRDPWANLRESLRAEGLVAPARTAPRMQPWYRRRSTAWPVAAAVLIGLFLAGNWLPFGSEPTPVQGVPRVAEGGARPGRDPSRTAGTDAETPSFVGPVAAIPASLRRLSPAEPRMRDTAWRFRPTTSFDVGDLGDTAPLAPANTPVSPVSLERVQLLPQNPPR